MTKPCAVPNCRTGYKSEKTKRSVFRVPKDLERLKTWEAAIPGNVKLRATHVICEKHFENRYISREWLKYDSNDKSKIIARTPYKYPQLNKLAVPTRFDENLEEKRPVDSIMGFLDAPSVEESSDVDDISGNRLSLGDNEEMVLAMEFTANGSDLLTECAPPLGGQSPDVHNISNNGSSIIDNGEMGSLMEVPDGNLPIDSSSTKLTMNNKQYSVVSTVTIREKIQKANSDTMDYQQYSTVIPSSWTVGESNVEKGQRLVFQYTVTKLYNDEQVPVVEKCVVLDEDQNLKYFVYGRRVQTQVANLKHTLGEAASLRNTLKVFQRMRICAGLGVNNKDFSIENAFADCIQQWRHDDCTLISKRKRCVSCDKLRNRVNQRIRSLKTRPKLKRIHRKASNTFDHRKISALLKRTALERRNRQKAERNANSLIKELQELREKVAHIEGETFEKKCSELNVPQAQKLALREIIKAASRKDDRGRRYTDEWMMLCMLMNIRSKGTYEFLRKNNVLPLPCSRTIRSYFSQIDLKCGFDEKFAELLKKHLESKTPLQRHGVLLLDEINLRKSVSVCSKNLTYVGLIDLGDDDVQSRDINDQATHGLVLMFQSIADKYTQPIAVFASKNPVKGEELAKLTVRGISYLENCGCKIHGIVADGAATNVKMWSMLGISNTMENTKTWFPHPLDGERKVFVFSDVPHLIKNVRNTLHNKKHLRLKRTRNYIRWQYFQHLYDLDRIHPGNIRACPKITARHVVLDSTSKMRVKLATQIFSNSVAQGLSFYLSHKCETLVGCEETISFCKQINDMFDALNRKSPNQRLVPGSKDFKVLEDSLRWLNEWESAVVTKDITPDEFLTTATSGGLRMSLTSAMDMCRYLINKFDFQYLLLGKVNQDNLEKFFGTVRQSAGCNDHPSGPTFLQLYKLLSVYSVIKPPKYGNCSIAKDSLATTVISITDLKSIYGEKSEAKSAQHLQKIRMKLDSMLQQDDWEADYVINYPDHDHEYNLSPIVDCIIYYVTGYLCKQILKKYKSCPSCEKAVRKNSFCTSSVAQFVEMKSRGGLIHANLHFFNLIRCIEASFSKYASRKDVFDLTLDEVLDTYSFTFPCPEHASDILSYAIMYYIRLRMRQNAHQENLKLTKKFVIKNKLSKLTNQ